MCAGRGPMRITHFKIFMGQIYHTSSVPLQIDPAASDIWMT
uniref:Uncharacterized protein n=1 Tax=Anguilla anguilla TaxID=7936 RepID=A0A0E9U7X3_ANGAN